MTAPLKAVDATADLPRLMRDLAAAARAAARVLATAPAEQKDRALAAMAAALRGATADILAANAEDVAEARAGGASAAFIDRLALNEARVAAMADGIDVVRAIPDPVGAVTERWQRPNGMVIERVRVPLGVIAVIFESRPNVAADAGALCLKSGNAVILRGGSEAIRSNLALGEELRAAAREAGLPEDAIAIVPTTDRAAIDLLLVRDRDIDLVIPRGGPGLIRKVTETSTIPVIKHDAGVCHIFLDARADPEMATAIVADSKIRQMAVCNGLETLLVHRAAAPALLPRVLGALAAEGIEIRGCPATQALFPDAKPATEEDWFAEYLAPILAVRVVDDLDAAVAHIRHYGSSHTEVIVTDDYASSQAFVRRVDSSTVGVNCSTAYADGYRLGLGAEIGISTSKLHAYGPMGLEGLTAQKFVLFGDGQLRPD